VGGGGGGATTGGNDTGKGSQSAGGDGSLPRRKFKKGKGGAPLFPCPFGDDMGGGLNQRPLKMGALESKELGGSLIEGEGVTSQSLPPISKSLKKSNSRSRKTSKKGEGDLEKEPTN